jgi:transposase
MRVLALDLETFYCSKTGYTLSKMTAEEYIRDPRFEIVGFAMGWLGQPKTWYTGSLDHLRQVAQSLDWSDVLVVGHNLSHFDSLILTEVLGVRPAHYGCTLQLARCLHGSKDADGKNISNSLSAVAKLYRREIEALLADKGYDAGAIRAEIEAAGVEAVIPAKSNRRVPIPHDREKHRWRNLVARLFSKPKNWRRVATRDDKTQESYLGFVALAPIKLWIPLVHAA